VRRALAAALALAALPAAAALFRSVTVEDAARASEAVVRGTVERRTSRVTPGGIVTDVEVAVASAWKGAPGSRVTVTIPGGMVGDVGEWVDAAPTFADGEEVVLFLARVAPGWRVNGLALGKFRVEGLEAVPEVDAAELRPARARPGEAVVARMKVSELERRVRGAR
jgi:hypothetical protein